MMNQWKDKKIAVLMGGQSNEREISLKSGHAVLQSLQRQGYQASGIDVGDNLATQLVAGRPHACVIALHGRYGEDGTVQGLLEMMRIPYSGSGVLASALCLDKALSKAVLSQHGIRMARSFTVHSEQTEVPAEHGLSLPLVVKPNREGSTLGIELVKDFKNLSTAIEKSLQFDNCVLVEEFISGTEVTVGIINGQALPVLEVVPHSGFYDFESKYTKGKTEYIVPARVSDAVTAELQDQSKNIYQTLNLAGVARIDFIVNADNEAVFLEVNTIPGMTETSLIPKAAAHIGIDFDGVVAQIVESIGLKL